MSGKGLSCSECGERPIASAYNAALVGVDGRKLLYRAAADNVIGFCERHTPDWLRWDGVRESESIEVALERARAAGYAEAIEKAAKVADAGVAEANRYKTSIERLGANWTLDCDKGAITASASIADAIRALAPATTKEPK